MKLFEKNIGDADRVLRFLVAVVFAAAGYLMLQAPLSYVAYLVALVLIFTGATRSCAAYSVIGISTMAKQEKTPKK